MLLANDFFVWIQLKWLISGLDNSDSIVGLDVIWMPMTYAIFQLIITFWTESKHNPRRSIGIWLIVVVFVVLFVLIMC